MEPWVTHVLAGLGGALIGGLIVEFWRRRSSGSPAAAKVQEELDNYREKVAHHFAQTANLVNDMTDRYRSVFEQLQTGADQLVEQETLRQLLGEQDGRTTTLTRLGYHDEQPTEEPDPSPAEDPVARDDPNEPQASATGGTDEPDSK
jgi:uncharacterized membrane-anchored protein YhcB (DUF1043 family)